MIGITDKPHIKESEFRFYTIKNIISHEKCNFVALENSTCLCKSARRDRYVHVGDQYFR